MNYITKWALNEMKLSEHTSEEGGSNLSAVIQTLLLQELRCVDNATRGGIVVWFRI